MSKITIKGDGNVVGNKNIVVSEISKGTQDEKNRQLNEAFALLKEEIQQLAIPEKAKDRSIRAIEDAEVEATDKSTDTETIKNSLNRMKEVLEDSGKVYDNTKSWGKRLFDLSQTIARYFPNLMDWANNL